MKKKVLFLCVENSSRSQMAEGLARKFFPESIEPYSAGINAGVLNHLAVAAMEEIGIDISGQRSKSLDDVAGISFDLVITLCDEAKEACPVFHGATRVIHMSFENPACAEGSPEEILSLFRKVRDHLRERMLPCLIK